VPTFTSHFEKALRVSAGVGVNGRLKGAAKVDLSDMTTAAPRPHSRTTSCSAQVT